jgi:hypothetical protein
MITPCGIEAMGKLFSFSYFGEMKKMAVLLLLCFSMTARSQEKDEFYVFDANWKPTTEPL